ncbi:ATP-binding protein [Streptomyces sp. NPDC056454]|uniref:ATP-binding protein n=1 Tax=Streptomyces sp. NPDC056454 TaxID=3345823 RepID=UPI0036C867C6
MHSPYSPSPPPLGILRNAAYRCAYPGVEESVSAARERLAQAVTASGLGGDIADTAALCLSEFATNAVVHAIGHQSHPRFVVHVSVMGHRCRYLRLEVHDPDGTHRPVFPSRDEAPLLLLEGADEATSGRGLAMVAAMADRTGVDVGPIWKSVWCELRIDEHTNGRPSPDVQGRAAEAFPAGVTPAGRAACP